MKWNLGSRVLLAALLVAAACDNGKGSGKGKDLGGDGGGGTAITLTVAITGEGGVSVDGQSVCTSAMDPCTVNVVIGDTTSVTATPAEGYQFQSWSCSGQISTNATLDLTLQSGAQCTVNFVKISETLMVSVTDGKGGKGGQVTSSVGNIACGSFGTACTAALDWGTAVTLTATPDANYSFVGWEGDCSGTTAAINLTIMAPTNCVARFLRNQVPLTLSVVGEGTLAASTTSSASLASCSQASCAPVNVDAGDIVSLLATPGSNYKIGSWAGDCVADASSNTAAITMDGAKSCVVTFVLNERTLVVNTTGNGTVTIDPLGTDNGLGGYIYTHGASVQLTANPGQNQIFLGWSGDCSVNASQINVTMDADKTCTAAFGPAQRKLTLSVVGPGKVTSAPAGIDTSASDFEQSYDHGTAVLLTAAPTTGYEVASWTGDCVSSGAAPTTWNLTMDADKSCTVTFKARLTVVVEGSGTVKSDALNPGIDTAAGAYDALYAADTVVTLKATPNVGGQQISFLGWSGSCSGNADTTQVTLAGAKSCTATFTVTPYDLTVSVAPAGGGNVTGLLNGAGNNIINCGTGGSDCSELQIPSSESVVLTATAATGYRFDKWSNCSTATTATLTVPMNATKTCTANFVQRGTVATANGTGGASATVASSAAAPNNCAAGTSCTIDGGLTVNLVATPSTGYRFNNWTGCTTAASTSASTTTTVVAGVTTTCTANYTKTYTVTFSKSGGGAASTFTASCGASPCTVDTGTNVTLTATADTTPPGYRFTNFTAGGGGSCSLTNGVAAAITSNQNCVANFVQRGTVATSNGTGGASATVASTAASPNNCAAGSSCTIDGGLTVNLVATPSAGYRFNNWTGCTTASSTSASTTTSVVAGTTTTCTANYTKTYTVTFSMSGGGASSTFTATCGSSPCTVDTGTSVTLTATAGTTPAPGYRFTGFTAGGGGTCSMSNGVGAAITSNQNCVANFVQRGTVATSNGTGGTSATVASTAAAPNDCAAGTSCTIDSGLSVNLLATPSAGYRFNNWTGCTTASSTSASTTTTVVGGTTTTCTANYTKTYTVTFSKSGGGASSTLTATCGSSPCTVDTGTNVTLTATADTTPPGYRFSGFTAGGGGTCSFTNGAALSVTSDQNCVANFVQRGTVATSNGTGGTSATVASTNASPNNCAAGTSCTIDGGLSVNLVATPAAGYRFNNWTGCTTASSTSASTTTTVVAGATTTCTANYTKTYTVTFSMSGGGASSTFTATCGSSPCTVDTGTNVTLTATAGSTPAPGYRFTGFTAGGGGTCSFTNGAALAVTSNQNCVANFVQRFTLAVVLDAEGEPIAGAGPGDVSGTLSCAGGTCSTTLDSGTSVSLTAKALQDAAKGADFDFINWSGCTSSTNTTIGFTLSANSTCYASFRRYWARAFGTDTYDAGLGYWTPVYNDLAMGLTVTNKGTTIAALRGAASKRGGTTHTGILRLPLWGDLLKDGDYIQYSLDPAVLDAPIDLYGVDGYLEDGHIAYGNLYGDIKYGTQLHPTFLRFPTASPGSSVTPDIVQIYPMSLTGDPAKDPTGSLTHAGSLGAAGYAMAGTFFTPTYNQTWGRVLGVDDKGNVLYDRLFCMAANASCKGCSSTTTPVALDGASDGSFVGVAGDGYTAQGSHMLWVAVLDKNGAIGTLKAFDFSVDLYSDFGINDIVISPSNKSAVVLGYVTPIQTGVQIPFVGEIGLSSASSFGWLKTYNVAAGQGGIWGLDLDRDGSGGYLVGGYLVANDPAYGYEGMFLHLDQNGDMILDAGGKPTRMMIYGSAATAAPNLDAFTQIAVNPIAGIQLAGATSSWGNGLDANKLPINEYDLWAMRVRSDGTIHFNTDPVPGPHLLTSSVSVGDILGTESYQLRQACNDANVNATDDAYNASAVTVKVVPNRKADRQQATQCGYMGYDTVY